jgi:hypothetical protein
VRVLEEREKVCVCVLQTLKSSLESTGVTADGPVDIARAAKTTRRKFKATMSLHDNPKLWESGQAAVKFLPGVACGEYGTVEHLFRCFLTDDRDGEFVMLAAVLPWPSAAGFPLPTLLKPIDPDASTHLIRVEMISTATVLFLPAIPLDLYDGWTHNVINLDP